MREGKELALIIRVEYGGGGGGELALIIRVEYEGGGGACRH